MGDHELDACGFASHSIFTQINVELDLAYANKHNNLSHISLNAMVHLCFLRTSSFTSLTYFVIDFLGHVILRRKKDVKVLI